METIFAKEMFAEALGLILVTEENADHEHIVEEEDMLV